MVLALAACPLFPAGAGEKVILHVYAWSGFFAPDVLAEFEDRHDCIVALDAFDSNEAMLASLDASDTAFDIITPSSYMAKEMDRRGLLSPIDKTRIPNLANIDAGFLALTGDPGMRYSVLYTRTVTGVGYNRRLLGDVEESWAIFRRDDLRGRLTMLDDMRETMGAALKYLGYSINTKDQRQLEEAGTLLLEWRDNLAAFEVDEANLGLGAGDYLAVHGYNGDLAVLMEENRDIGFFVPREGSVVSTDAFVIPERAANRELAHTFINHILEPRVAAANMREILYFMPVPEAVALLDAELRANPAFAVSEETLAKSEVIMDLGADTARYEEVWARIVP